MSDDAAVIVPTETAVADAAPVVETGSILGDAAMADIPAVTEPVVTESPKVDDVPVDASVDAPAVPKEGEAEVKSDDAITETSEEVAPIVLDPFEMPEGVEYNPEGASVFTGILSDAARDYGLNKDQVQELGQKLIGLHIERSQSYIDAVQTAWAEQQEAGIQAVRDAIGQEQADQFAQWAKDFEADEEFGGKRRDTSLTNAKSFIKAFSTAEDAKALSDMFNKTGVGNHPAMIRLMARAGEAVNNAAKAIPGSPSSPKTDMLTGMYGPSAKAK